MSDPAPKITWYGTARWKRRRAHQLASEPLCRKCLERGMVKSATVADHIIPHRGDADLFWGGKLQSLCKVHHDSSKQREEAGTARLAIGADGWPIESRANAESGIVSE